MTRRTLLTLVALGALFLAYELGWEAAGAALVAHTVEFGA